MSDALKRPVGRNSSFRNWLFVGHLCGAVALSGPLAVLGLELPIVSAAIGIAILLAALWQRLTQLGRHDTFRPARSGQVPISLVHASAIRQGLVWGAFLGSGVLTYNNSLLFFVLLGVTLTGPIVGGSPLVPIIFLTVFAIARFHTYLPNKRRLSVRQRTLEIP